MRNYLKRLILTVFAGFSILLLNAQTFECRVIENDYGYLVYQMRETSGTGTPTTSTNIVDITFVIRYPSGAVDIELLCSTNDYNIMDGLAEEKTSGGYDYHYWNASNTPFNPPNNWTVNQWEDIAVFKATGATGSGLFEVAPNGFDGRDLNWNQEGLDYLPTVNGDVTYSYPTTVYDLVWTGSDATYPTYWDVAGNWNDECGGAGSIPNTGNNCVIPVVTSGNYPINIGQVSGFGVHQPLCDYLRINSGANMSIDNKDFGGSQAVYTVNNDLIVKGSLTVVPGGRLTVSGSTEIDNSEGIEVQADATGVASFIDNGTITYGTSGTGKVQTFLHNGAGAGNFYIHTVGPTVDDENYTGSGTGAFLSAFNISPGNTYAYAYDQGTDNWDNINNITYEVHTADGIALSTTDATDYTLNMTGEFITGNVTHAITTGGNNYQLISNPYPSAIDFDALYNSNSTLVQNKTWIWDPSTGNYVTWSSGTGNKYVQVGQGFFVETKAPGTFTFTNDKRVHNNVAFRNENPDELTVKVSGGNFGFKDELVIRFIDNATSGYDEEIDAYKKESMKDDATQISSVAEDGSKLAINFMPVASLNENMVSVPVNFSCGFNGEYTFDFEGVDSFERGNEIWLEDKKEGGDWVNLNENTNYSFTGSPDDAKDRFVLHFFGPTGINDKEEAVVKTYSWKQYAYVKNVTNEKIKKVLIYDLTGGLVKETEIPAGQELSKIWVANHDGYYVIQVITENSVFTNKILISK